jgi:hypothetical protein
MIIQHNHLNPTGAFVPARAKLFAPDPAAGSFEQENGSLMWPKKDQLCQEPVITV